ncbi:hypothetical protein CPC08DRAFT_742940 [Agrocybe pediades]|nr:hypothetical protein CPC08DRAFT_742940 [Agrocybe pediades]
MPAFQPPVASSSKRKLDSIEHEERLSGIKRALPSSFNSQDTGQAASIQQTWMVQWRNFQYKKHKTWDGDAILVICKSSDATLYDTDGKILGTGKVPLPLSQGKGFSFAGKDIELDREIANEAFLSGTCFSPSTCVNASGDAGSSNHVSARQYASPALKTSQFKAPSMRKPAYPTSKSAKDDNNRPIGLAEVTNFSLHWTANWRKPQEKKNKTWDGDAYVSLMKDKLVMISEDGKVMGSTPWKGQVLSSGLHTYIGGKEVELDVAVSGSLLPTVQGMGMQPDEPPDDELEPNPTSASKQPARYVAPATFYTPSKAKAKEPLHDPHAPDSLVMKEPNKEHMKKYNKRNLPVIPVVIDPLLSRRMRPHQKEGLKFLYESVMGLRKHEGQGCILADEMGLGKTLQTIALVWTLLRQNPYAAPNAAVQKVLIVCPVSLVNNWKAEFHKWLGRDRLGIFTCDKSNSNIHLFGTSKVYEVLIIGYERLRTVIDKLANIYPPIGLIICDEGHRLKSANNKTAASFKAFDTRRRVILSGTPIQNDLGEFHAMADFCNPGLLDDYNVFRKVYETPILKSRAPDASAKEIEIGEARTAQLLAVSKSFVLRREASLLKNHLPPKSEYVVFIVPTELQISMFQKILHPKKVDDIIQSSTAESLALINILTKISNSPILLKAAADSAKGRKNDNTLTVQNTAVAEALDLLPERAHVADTSLSGKLIFLSGMLKLLRQNTSEKCVLVSHYTSTLNILETYCKSKSYSYYRLDGQTPQNKRQEYVNAFNMGTQQNSFIFLLSSKAGGVGINLIGGSRLFIIDSDWNPSHDLQSMARCHRDGQKKPVYIYRMLTAGAIDEKIYQRQVTKLALGDSLIGSGTANSKSDSFTRKDLRDIFRIHLDTACNTHDLLECNCGNEMADLPDVTVPSEASNPEAGEEDHTVNMGFVSASTVTAAETEGAENAYFQKKKAALASLGKWNHVHCLRPAEDSDIYVHDDILRRVVTRSSRKLSEGTEELSLLDRIDIDRIQALTRKSLRDAPGGSVSFLFERCSKTGEDDSTIT